MRAISPDFESPIAERRAWAGISGGGATPAWIQTTVSRADSVGSTVRFRFRFASDFSMRDVGWWIDDIQVPAASACSSGPTDGLFANGFEPAAPTL